MLPRNYQEICYNSRTNILTAVWNIKRNTNPPLLLPLRLLVWWVPSVISLIELSTIQDGGLLPCSSAFAPSVIDQNIPWNNTIMKKLGGEIKQRNTSFSISAIFSRIPMAKMREYTLPKYYKTIDTLLFARELFSVHDVGNNRWLDNRQIWKLESDWLYECKWMSK